MQTVAVSSSVHRADDVLDHHRRTPLMCEEGACDSARLRRRGDSLHGQKVAPQVLALDSRKTTRET